MRIYTLLAAMLFPVAALAQKDFTITGKLGEQTAPKTAYIGYGGKLQDSVTVKNGTFSFKGKIKDPQFAALFIRHNESPGTNFVKLRDTLFFVLESGNIRITSRDSLVHSRISGSQINSEFDEFKKAIEADPTKKLQVTVEFIKTHPNSYLALSFLNIETMQGLYSRDAAKLQFERFAPEIKESELGKHFITDLNAKLQIGSPPPNFTHDDLNGRPISLSAFKGKYVLVDFWASWCHPCRDESPNLMKAYKALYNKGLEIISISIDADLDAWKKAIATDGLPWTHICDKGSKDGIADAYGITSIPRNFLIDPNGNLVGSNFRGDDIDKQLAQIMKVQPIE